MTNFLIMWVMLGIIAWVSNWPNSKRSYVWLAKHQQKFPSNNERQFNWVLLSIFIILMIVISFISPHPVVDIIINIVPAIIAVSLNLISINYIDTHHALFRKNNRN